MGKKAGQARPNHLLRAARKERGWTQKDVADRIGAPLSLNVTRWEGGTSFPSAHYVERLCQIFGKSARELGLIQEEYTYVPDESADDPDATIVLGNPSPLPPPPPSPPEPASQRSLFRPKVMLLIGLVLLIVIASTGFLYMTYVSRNAAHRVSTPTHIVTAADAQATAHAAATATLVAMYPDPYFPHMGKLIFYDPLSAPYLWTHGTVSSSTCQFTQGVYHVIESQTQNDALCWNQDFDFKNFAFEVQMKITQGDCGGILSRSNPATNYQFYELDVCQDGSYNFLAFSGPSNYKTLASKTSPAITIGLNQLNLIAIVANGRTFDLYVNKQKIDSIQDSTYSHGQIGLLAFAGQNAPTDVIYSQAKAWIP
ncbi:MAG: helix-turn-helix domain-containing protein [Chloroflexi bacterium]|nr:helix-turn-helix domain-containing protein [Chloroflexota bacterium]